ncbi:unnamed protein product [Schistosoma bovis]|nr:unnamed protein product [Schistosoma bovis]
MVDAFTCTASQDVTNNSCGFRRQSLTPNFQAGLQPSDQIQEQTSFDVAGRCSIHAHIEGISRNYVPTYVHSNFVHGIDSIPFVRSCPNMGDYHAFENVNNGHSNRLFSSQFLTSCPPAIPEVQSDLSQDEEVSRPCCFCTFCAPVIPKTHCFDICCFKSKCLVPTVSPCPPNALFCLLFTGPCKCPLFSFPRHRVTNENLIILSIIQLLCGFAAIVLSSVAFTKSVFLYQMATGLWAGILMVVTGFHGLLAARRPIVCALVGLLVLCMVVSLSACVLICVSVAGTIEDGFLSSTVTRKGFSRELTKISPSHRENKTFFQRHDPKSSLAVLTTRTQDWSDLQLSDFKNVLRETSDTYVRTCQVILHLLLLVVGILEASVSLATSILCCRCVCSNSLNLRFQNSRSLRTNIVSFNAATANQAASVLRSGAINDFVGTGNVILALDSDVPTRNYPISNANEVVRKPQIHHTLIPFLSELNRHSLILTQAGTGTVALSAARAAANLFDSESFETQDRTSVACSSSNEQSSTRQPGTLSRSIFRRLKGLRLIRPSEPRPHLLYTTLQVPINVSNTSDSSSNPLPFSSSTTIVYVMLSPTHEEPPMIFPPFPPSYNESQRRSGLSAAVTRIQRNQRMTFQSNPSRRYRRRSAGISRPRFHSSIRSRLSRLLCRNASHQSNLRINNTSRHSRMQCHLSRSVASAPISFGDRFIQPVLIVGDPPTIRPTEEPPPKYSI